MNIKKFTVKETGVSIKVEIADNFIKRFMGLMGRNNIGSAQGLFLASCNSIHMCFMKFAIDVIYVDKNFKIKKITHNLKPWTGVSMCFGAFGVIEVTAGDAKKFDFSVGQMFNVSMN